MALAALILCCPSSAFARSVHYAGHMIRIPAGWPVYDLEAKPSTCVRFDRHAVYLGSPSARQRCPAFAIGRTEAILVSPAGKITATWNRHPALIRQALGRLPSAPASTARLRTDVRSERGTVAGAVYTGLGFDVCSAPSTSQMSAWSSTKYHAIGVYVGGTNSACSQPNLTAAWVTKESAAGWHLIPTYVGLQAPGACGCSTINSATAGAEGTAAANDAISRSQTLGLGTGNPIYYDMEAYPNGGAKTSTVLKFLSAWSARLHSAGYISGVYSSGASGIQDLAAKYGTSYGEPDDLWVADWNGTASASDPYIPAADWNSHQRIHQYSGGHSETHGGVTLDIDGDYLDGSTAGPASVAHAPLPSVKVRPAVDGSVHLNATWPGATGIAAWQVLAGPSSDALTPLGTPATGGATTAITVHSQFSYYAVEALDSTGQLLGTAPAEAAQAHLAIYGRSAFVPARGLGGLPAGCFTAADCQLTTTITDGNTVVAAGRAQQIGMQSGGILHFKMTSAGRSLLQSAGGHLRVKALIADASGTKATTGLKLISFSTGGKAPPRSVDQASTLRFLGVTDFVYRNSVGGILASCPATVPCDVTTTIKSGGRTIATAGPQFLGSNELGYLTFKLTPAGRRLMAHAHGNSLAASVTLNDATSSAVASAQIALVGYR